MIHILLTAFFVVVFFAIRVTINDAFWHARNQRRLRRRK